MKLSLVNVPDCSPEGLLEKVQRYMIENRAALADFCPVPILEMLKRDIEKRGDLRGKEAICLERFFPADQVHWLEGVRQFLKTQGCGPSMQLFLASLLDGDSSLNLISAPIIEGQDDEYVIESLFQESSGKAGDPDERTLHLVQLGSVLPTYKLFGMAVRGFKAMR